jgi:hypothetical protein
MHARFMLMWTSARGESIARRCPAPTRRHTAARFEAEVPHAGIDDHLDAPDKGSDPKSQNSQSGPPRTPRRNLRET